MSTRALFRTPRPALKIIDCEKINKICSLIRIDGPLEEKAKNIKEKLLEATVDKDMLPLLENIDDFIIKGEYTDAEKLANDIWLIYRQGGIGGSDAASIMGLSKWRTALELYYDKIGEKSIEKIDKHRQYIFDFGHAMEEFVAKHYEKVFMSEYKESTELSFSIHYGQDLRITGCKVYRDTFMYKSPENPFMRADLDFCIDLKFDNGKIVTGIFECKTTSPFQIKEEWDAAPPPYYTCQTRHYMAVMDYPFAIIACASDNNANNYYSHIIFRNKRTENRMISQEKEFWMNVINKTPPLKKGVDNYDVLLQKIDLNSQKEARDQSQDLKEIIEKYQDVSSSLSECKNQIKKLEKEKNIVFSDLLTYMIEQDKNKITSKQGDSLYTISVNEKVSNAMDWDKFVKALNTTHPELADEINSIKNSCRKDTSVKRTATINETKIKNADVKKAS